MYLLILIGAALVFSLIIAFFAGTKKAIPEFRDEVEEAEFLATHSPEDFPDDFGQANEDIKVELDATLKKRIEGRAFARGISERNKILSAEGGTWKLIEVSVHLKIIPQDVDKCRRDGRLLGLQESTYYVYPAWQFTQTGILNGLEKTLVALKDHDPWMQAVFMLNSNSKLGGNTPLSYLRKGSVKEVLDAASIFGEFGGS